MNKILVSAVFLGLSFQAFANLPMTKLFDSGRVLRATVTAKRGIIIPRNAKVSYLKGSENSYQKDYCSLETYESGILKKGRTIIFDDLSYDSRQKGGRDCSFFQCYNVKAESAVSLKSSFDNSVYRLDVLDMSNSSGISIGKLNTLCKGLKFDRVILKNKEL